MKKSGYTINNIYQGGYSTFKPTPRSNYHKTGSFGITTDPRNANVLQEVSSKLSAGVKNVEIEMVTDGVLDKVPKQQFEEVKRLSKLTGVDVSVHGPVINTTGVDQRGGYSETNRELAERKIIESLKRSHDINPDGNIVVNFHSAEGLPGSEFKTLGKDRKAKRLVVVDRESGQLRPADEEIRHYPGLKGVKQENLSPERRLEMMNDTEWDNSLFQIEANRENAERIMQDIHPLVLARFSAVNAGKLDPKEISREEQALFDKVGSAYEYIRQAKLSADSLFDKAYKYAKEDKKEDLVEALNEISRNYAEEVGIDGKKVTNTEKYLNPKVHSQALHKLTAMLKNATPRVHVPIEEFAVKESSKTYGNAAFEAYKKFKNTAPIVAIENPPIGFALGTGQDVAELVKASQKHFVEKATKPKSEGGLGLDKSKAEKEAKKLIGTTLDVGHMNMLRRQGFKEKDIIKESKLMAPYLKHLHLSDNFGLEHTEIPMGMGNVPLPKIMEHLKKEGVDTDKMKQIIEAGDWWATFRSSPVYATLEGMGSPMYSTDASPYWSQSPGLYQGYSGGMAGPWLPQVNYESFGAGFSQLPAELGGQRPGAQGSRMSGQGME